MKVQIKIRQLPIEGIIIYLLLFASFTLSIIQFIADRSLWIDEVALASNIVKKTYLELLTPLDYKQVAPIGFLWIEKFIADLFPDTDYGLRIWPLISYMIATILLWQVGKKMLSNFYAQILCLSLWVFNSHLLYYSSEVKQYMSDVTIGLGLIWLLLNRSISDRHYFTALTVGGIIAFLISNIAIVVLTSIGIYFLLSGYWLTHRKALVITGAGWIFTFFVYYGFFIHDHPTRNTMIEYWTNANAFWSGLPWQKQFYSGLYQKALTVCSLFDFSFKKSILLFGLFALSFFLAPERKVAVLLALPITIHLTLAYFDLYPFHARLILYLLPFVILLAGISVQRLIEWTFSDLGINRFRMIAFAIPLALVNTVNWNEFPFEKEEIKKTISYIKENKRPDEKVYIYFMATLALEFYENQGKVQIDSTWKAGSVNFSDRTACIDEILALEGKYWILFYHTRINDKNFLLEKINNAGIKVLDKLEVNGSSVYLFDFTKKEVKTQ